MDSSNIQQLLDQVKPVRVGRPFDLYDGPEETGGFELRVHWHDEQQRWIYCERDSCSRQHVTRPLRYAAYLTDDGSPAKAREDMELVLAPRQLLKTEEHWRPGDALVKFGSGLQTRYETCDRKSEDA